MEQNVSLIDEANFYGPERWEPVARLTAGRLADNYAMLLPLWRYSSEREAVRYLGFVDLDLPDDKGPLFPDDPRTYLSSAERKRHFSARLRLLRGDVDQLCAVCPAFARITATYRAIQAALQVAGVPHLAYFSGGKGWHVFFQSDSPELWRRQPAQRGGEFGPAASAAVVAYLNNLGATVTAPELDHSVYTNGVKTDMVKHPDTKLWPCKERNGWLVLREEDWELGEELRMFWAWAQLEAARQLESSPKAPGLFTLPKPRGGLRATKASEACRRTNGHSKPAAANETELQWVEARFGQVERVTELKGNIAAFQLASRHCPRKRAEHSSNHCSILLKRGCRVAVFKCLDPDCSADKLFAWPRKHYTPK